VAPQSCFPSSPHRNFVAPAPNCVWLADITYVETDQGWLYLATVMDLYSRRIVGWAMADHLRTELPLAALRMAIAAKQPGPGPDPPFRPGCSICL
jgi:transposase InsO family protein